MVHSDNSELLLILALLANWAVVIGLKLENVSIPKYGVKDGSAVLRCDFLLESDNLLVLKWYKDQHEFYRYSPQLTPNILTFPVDGVNIDQNRSGLNQVTIRNISLGTGGTYKCEVSADKPSFRTLSSQGHMDIIAPPTTPPNISGIQSGASVGDMISGNCTSRNTKPAADLNFYINGEKAEPEYISEYLSVPQGNGLESSALGLRFQLEARHFRYGQMEVKCTATLGNGYWVGRMIVTELEGDIKAQPSSPGHNRLFSGESPVKCNTGSLSFFSTALLQIFMRRL